MTNEILPLSVIPGLVPGIQRNKGIATDHMNPCVYMMASKRNGTLYTGVTSDLPGRAFQHRQGLSPGFTSRYGCKTLVWYEAHDTMKLAIQCEKTIKRYPRRWKLNLIEGLNPDWDDLYETLNG